MLRGGGVTYKTEISITYKLDVKKRTFGVLVTTCEPLQTVSPSMGALAYVRSYSSRTILFAAAIQSGSQPALTKYCNL